MRLDRARKDRKENIKTVKGATEIDQRT